MNHRDPFADMGDKIAELSGELSAQANRLKLGLLPQSSPSASAQIVNGSTAVGLVGIFAIVIALAAVVVVAAWRDADARVFEARAEMQAATNENLTDRVAVLERIIARMERDAAERGK